jgi:hypothetical protein
VGAHKKAKQKLARKKHRRKLEQELDRGGHHKREKKEK